MLLALFCFLVYNANLRGIGSGDTLPARYLPFDIWKHGSLLLDPIRDSVSESSVNPYWIVTGPNGHSISMYPVVVPVLVAPLYLPAVAYIEARGWTEWRLQHLAIVMEKLISSLLAALAVGLLYLLLRRRASPVVAGALALVFALGTNTWMIGSQALWQHGLAELLLVGTLLLLTGRCTTASALATGTLLGLVVCNRPPDALLAAPLALYGLVWARRKRSWLAAGAAIPLTLVLAYDLGVTGNPFGGYGVRATVRFFRFGLLSGLAGLLLSPARGLLAFSPVLGFVPAALRRGLRDRGARALTLAIGTGLLAQLLFYAKLDWRAGHSWGPRWLTDVLPLLVWLLPPVVAVLGGLGRAIFALAACASIAVQFVGAFWYTGESDRPIFAPPPGPDELYASWDPRNWPPLAELRHPMAPPDPALLPWRTPSVRGSLDRVTAFAPDTRLILEGWALQGDRAPSAVQATIDGSLRGGTETFLDRRDVRASLQTTESAGWQVAVDTHGLSEGTHTLAVRARLRDSALTVPFASRTLVVAGPPRTEVPRRAEGETDSLADAARQAAALLQAHQQPAGFWLTQYTGTTRFEAAHPEMNTFLTSMMIDEIEPVAAKAGLGASLIKARTHLRDQIEDTGLVRFHGLPDGPTIGTLGCRITPDADDTALAWRLAPGDRALLPRALATLASYRTREGLYRTWLAPRERYECLDPGRDPNPPDAGIQMNVYLFLASADPAAARRLCRAFGPAIEQDRLWVYYDMAPLVPLLRQADLERAGCRLRLPRKRMATPVAGQAIWLTLAKSLQASTARTNPDGASPSKLELLRNLAADDFTLVRRAPPLLYHNDLSASVRRFYWSEDFGYALWLRLYFANESERRADIDRR